MLSGINLLQSKKGDCGFADLARICKGKLYPRMKEDKTKTQKSIED